MDSICPGLVLLPLTTQICVHNRARTPVAQVTSLGVTCWFEITNRRCSHPEDALQLLEFRLLLKDTLTCGPQACEPVSINPPEPQLP